MPRLASRDGIRSVVHRWANHAVRAGWARIQELGEVSPGTRAGEEFGTLGEGACLGFPHATLMNVHAVHVGAHTLIGRHVTLSVGYGPLPPGDPRVPARGLVIGERCVIGARSSLTAHESIVVEDDVWLGQDVFIGDASHGYQDPDVPVGEQFGEHRPVRIGRGSWIGHGAIVLPGVTLGRNVVVAAGSVVRGTVPDHAVVAGVPARVVRERRDGAWEPVSAPR